MTTTALIILDGWGYSSEIDHNAIHAARTPVWDELWAHAPHSLLECSGQAVGLPLGQMGNSEVGHMTIGAGRAIPQDLTRIDSAVDDGTFGSEPVVQELSSIPSDKQLHVLGLLSPGGVHSHEKHIEELIRGASDRGVTVRLHAFLDGRDTPPRSATDSLTRCENLIRDLQTGSVATVAGRYYAMDRDLRWERTKLAYDAIVEGRSSSHAKTAVEALSDAYSQELGDEFLPPTVIGEPCSIDDGDSVVFMNFRADRARQLSRAIVLDDFDGFERTRRPKLALFATLTDYSEEITRGSKNAPVKVIFPTQTVVGSVGQCVAENGISQLRIAESEKYAHVTYFFSGGREEPFAGEGRKIIPSPKVKTYDEQPEMSATALTDQIVRHINAQDYGVIIANFANGDMVGHTGNMRAAIQAAECIDQCLGRIINACRASNAQCLITADHGNIEDLWDETVADANTAHTTNPVPLVYVGEKQLTALEDGSLADVAPTFLNLLGIEPPSEMTGRSLLRERTLAESPSS